MKSFAFMILVACVTGALGLSAATLRVPTEYSTIQTAIERAASGDTVLVEAGTYHEAIILKPQVVLRSKRGANVTRIDGTGLPLKATGVRMAAGSVLRGFTVANFGNYDEAKWNHHHATSGDEQSHEHIGVAGNAGILIQGVDCEVRDNIVHHIGRTGIGIEGTCSPKIVANTCYRNMGGGIGSMNGSTALIRDNICFENFYAGIGHDNASPLVVSNLCHGNIRAGIGVSEGSCAIVRSNLCHSNRRAGIGIRTGANTKPTIEFNTCRDNGMAGIGVEEEANPTIRGNRCHGNGLTGIGLQEHASATIVQNECYENGQSGIGLSQDSSATIRGNHIHHNKASGIGFARCKKGKAVIEDNRLLENAKVAAGVNPGWTVVFKNNEFSRTGGMPPLMMIFGGSDVTFTGNTFRGGGVAGIRVQGSVKAAGNRFEGTNMRRVGPPNYAIWALPGADIQFADNTVSGWRHAIYADRAKVIASGNEVSGCPKVAFRLQHPVAGSKVSGNNVDCHRELQVDK
ncbi:MAG: right-handed parallel beta-helix repeat-containing protein [Limisphaerales bacterium]